MIIDIQLFISSLPTLLRGASVSLFIAGMSCLIGIVGGTILGFLQSGTNRIASWLVTAYVTIIRGTPMLIQIYVFAYVLPEVGIYLPGIWAAIAAIGFNSSAYVSQIVRLGIASVGKGQLEAAQVLGFSRFQTMRYIIAPQALRTTLPALANELVTLIKDSSLASLIGVAELAKQGSVLRSITLDATTIFLAVGLIYLVMTSAISLFVYCLEKRMNHARN